MGKLATKKTKSPFAVQISFPEIQTVLQILSKTPPTSE